MDRTVQRPEGSGADDSNRGDAARPTGDAALLAAVLRQLPQGVIVAEAPGGRLLAGNEQVARIWRHPFKPSGSIEEYAEWRGFHLDGTPYRPEEWPLARAIAAGETVTDELIAIERGDGSRGVLQVSASPVRDDAGRVVAGVVTFTDVTEQRRLADRMERLHFVSAALAEAVTAEEAADVVLAAARATFRASGACVALAGDHTAEDESATLAILRSDGQPPDAPDWERLATEERSPIARAARLGRNVVPGDGDEPELPSQEARAAEQPSRHTVAALPLVAEGRVLGVLGLAFPASRALDEDEVEFAQALALQCGQALERARLYAAEKAAREHAERALRAREGFLSAAAHELKTPLTSLQGAAQLALRRLDREGSLGADVTRQTLDLVVQQAKRLARLVVALLDVTRLESGNIAVDRRPENVAAMVRHAVESMQGAAHQHRLSVTGPAEARAVVDRMRLEQVLMSLIDNAVKYTPAGTRIVVSLEHEQGDEGGVLSITVTDDGPGVAPEHRGRIFERYYRGDPKTSLSGMGLGLYLCREIARAHGGDLIASFPQDGGACFELRLPALSAAG